MGNRRTPRLIGLLASAGLLCGCGVSVYEGRFQETRERLARLDEEDQLLGEPVVLPQAWPIPIFLRPPRSVSSVAQALPGTAPDWLLRCSWVEPNLAAVPWEMYLGVYPFSGEREQLETLVQNDLVLGMAQAQRIQESAAFREAVFTRVAARPDDRLPIAYRRFVFLSEESNGPRLSRKSNLPAPCWFRWEVYIHSQEDWHIIVAFKVLDREATERSWVQSGASPVELRTLPVVDRKLFGRQRDACLATLRIGEAAQRAWKDWTGP